MNIGEDNSTTSGNGTMVNEYIYSPDIDAESEETFNLAHEKPKRQTRSYKTELGKMTRQRNAWRFAAYFFCAAELLRVIIQHITS